MKILDGRKARDSIAEEIKSDLRKLHTKPILAIVQIGDNTSSSVYIQQKKIFGEKLGFSVIHIQLNEKIKELDVISTIHKLNNDKKINGIIIQLPLPKNLYKQKILETILPNPPHPTNTTQHHW